MSFRVATALLSAVILNACATIHNGEVGKTVAGETVEGLDLSATQVNDPKKEPFFLSTVTFENKSDKWIRITQIEPVIGKDLASKISVVLGDDLKDWAMARADREQMEAHNKQMAQLAIMGAGTVAAVAASGRNSGIATGGLIAVSGTYGWVISDAISASRSKARNPNWVPDSHVQTPFAVPGKSFVRKWILFNVPLGVRLSEIPFKILTADGRQTIINVKVEEE